jgi:hypothetical protein
MVRLLSWKALKPRFRLRFMFLRYTGDS